MNTIASKEEVKIGDRVRVTGILPNDPDPLEIGDEGEVTNVVETCYYPKQIWVIWKSGRGIMLCGDDPFEVIQSS